MDVPHREFIKYIGLGVDIIACSLWSHINPFKRFSYIDDIIQSGKSEWG